MERHRKVETKEYEPDESFMAYCTACNIVLIEETTQPIAECVAREHINNHNHTTFVASAKRQPYSP